MEEVISYLLAAIVAILAGDRVYQGMRSRHRSNNPGVLATKHDIQEVQKELMALNKTVGSLHSALERHLGYHEGIRAG